MSDSILGLGGCEEVGRSSFLLDIGEKILLECGIKLSPTGTEYPLPLHTNLDVAIISHAHLDHSGNLPHLFLKSNPLCYMTQPTLDLAELLWHDTLKIAGLEGTEEKFSKEEIKRTRKYSFAIGYNRKMPITKKCSMEFFNAGHILGSVLTKLSFSGKSLLYTGDFKVKETRLLEKADLKVGHVDYVVIESTYGDREHPDRKKTEKEFVEKVQDTVDRGGTALVPAFAVGRSHEIIDVLHEYKLNAPVYLDGMAKTAARITMNYPKFLKDAKFLGKALKSTKWIKNEGQRRHALKEPSVIVTTAGMLEGGPVLNYIKKIHADKNSSVLLTGYQVEQTKGRRLLETGKIEVDGETYKLKCDVQKFDFSAHASQSEMLYALNKWSPQKAFIVHGEKSVAHKFGKKIKEELGINAVVLKQGKTEKLD